MNFGRGRRSVGAAQIKVLITGTKLSTGTATVEVPVQFSSEDEADTLLGAGSEAALQAYAALAIPGVVLWACPVAEAGSAVAGSLTIAVGGSWTDTGTARVFLHGKAFSATATPAMSTAQVAQALADQINSDSRLFCTASVSTSTITLTTRSKGVRMNKFICRKDLSLAPTGLTLTLTGGTALTGGMVPFASGAGADDVTNALAALATDRWHIQAWAQSDATNAALIRTQLNSEAGALIMHYEHAIMALTGTTSSSTSFASTTLNNQRMTLVHLTNAETHPSAIVAQVAAVRSIKIGANPNARYNGLALPSIAPQSQRADIPSQSVLNTMLNSGVLPLTTTSDGQVVVVRAIQSHCLNGSSPDFRTLDWGQVDVGDRLSDEADAAWDEHSQSNPYVGAEPAAGEDTPPEGTTYPSLWNSQLLAILRRFEKNNWVQEVDTHLPLTEFQSDRLMSSVPYVARLQNHILGLEVNQTASSL